MRNTSQTPLSTLSQVNSNVILTFLYRFSDGIAQGVWSAASMASYIYLLEHRSTKVPHALCTVSGWPHIAVKSDKLAPHAVCRGSTRNPGYSVALSAIPGMCSRLHTASKAICVANFSFRMLRVAQPRISGMLQLDGWLTVSGGTGSLDFVLLLHAVSLGYIQ